MTYKPRKCGQNDGRMGILDDLLQRVRNVNNGLQSGSIVRPVVMLHATDILDLQREQLFEGKASSGEDIRPYYSEDLKPSGYFYSVESAGRYAAWKLSGINYPYSAQNRNPDAPNLYITGKFHDEIGVEFGSDSVGIVGTTPFAKQIIAKYGIRTFGLMPVRWSQIFTQKGGYEQLMSFIELQLYVY